MLHGLLIVLLPRDMPLEEAIELASRSIYHATFRDCASGGTVSGEPEQV